LLPNAVDLEFAVFFAVGGALLDYFVFMPRVRKAIESGRPGARAGGYRVMIVGEWALVAFVAGRWLWLQRPRSMLWLIVPQGWRLIVAGAIVVATAWLLVAQIRSVATLDAEKRAALRPSLGSVAFLLPHTAVEKHWFLGLSVTAGVCEEVLYRGFLVWAMQPWLGLWGAALVSVLAFGVAHAYQGSGGLVRTTLVGAVLGGIALLTGSILPGIVVHAMVDVLGGTTGYLILRDPEQAQATAGQGR